MKQATALAPGWLDVAVRVGQLSGDALPQIVDMMGLTRFDGHPSSGALP
jgi:hypothetical protein